MMHRRCLAGRSESHWSMLRILGGRRRDRMAPDVWVIGRRWRGRGACGFARCVRSGSSRRKPRCKYVSAGATNVGCAREPHRPAGRQRSRLRSVHARGDRAARSGRTAGRLDRGCAAEGRRVAFCRGRRCGSAPLRTGRASLSRCGPSPLPWIYRWSPRSRCVQS